MGEIADMMLDGILDANGEYTGHDYGHPVYPKGWFEGDNETSHSVTRVVSFMKDRGIKEPSKRGEIVREYMEHIGSDSRVKKFGKQCKIICKDNPTFNKFKKWLNAKIGYVKPSKQNKSEI